MNKRYQLIAFDMDGTLLNSRKQISEETRKAIRYAVRNGKVVALSTGRCLPELYEFLDVIPEVRYLICVSGGYIYDTAEHRFIYNNPLKTEDVKRILEVSRQEDCMVHMLNDLSIVSKSDVSRMEEFHMAVYRPMYERVTTMVDDIYTYYEINLPQITKLNLYHRTETDRERTISRLSNLNIEVVRSEVTSAECSNKGVTKGTGLLQLCRHLSIEIEETIAVGDADNDIEILKTAGHGIAMANANEHVKKICPVVVADNDHDGCAEAIYKYLM